MNDWKIPTVDDIRATNERNRMVNEMLGRYGKIEEPSNSWREIRKARRDRRGLPYRVAWASGFMYGAITLAVMSGLVYLAWRAF
jgi:hypothetical protein